jgi:hypothetical protein
MSNKKIFNVSFLFILIVVLISTSGCTYEDKVIYNEIEDYQQCINDVEESDEFMPNLDSLTKHTTIELYCKENIGLTTTINLIVTYSEANYYLEKENLLMTYDFLLQPLYDSDRVFISEPEFIFNGFNIKVVYNSNYNYPEEFGMIGFNDEEYQVAYMFHSDRSYNTLGTDVEDASMVEFISSRFSFGNTD